MNLVALILACVSVSITWGINVQVTVDKSFRRYIPIPTPYFLGVTFDSCFIKYKFCHIDWMKAINLARFMGPGYLRIGGTDADYLTFIPPQDAEDSESSLKNKTEHKSLRRKREISLDESFLYAENGKPPKDCSTESMFVHSPYTMTGVVYTRLVDQHIPSIPFIHGDKGNIESTSQLDRVAWFARNAGWRLIFDLNLAKRTETNAWDTRNAIEFLTYADRMQYNMDFELGNEMNGYPNPHGLNITVNGSQLAKDYATLRSLLQKFETFKSSKLVGPAIGSFTKILKEFLKDGGGRTVDAVTLHEYYGDGRTAKIQEFTDPKRLDGLVNDFKPVLRMVKKYYPNKPPEVWYGETSTMYHGGAKNLSDRYVAGFMWLDKLGLSAKYGLTGVIRQTFFMGNYAVLDPETDPNPAQPCLSYCSLTFYGMNLLNDTVQVTFPSRSKKILQYLLEPEHSDLLSKRVLLNGKVLSTDGRNFPSMKPFQTQQPIALHPKRFAFYVFEGGCT